MDNFNNNNGDNFDPFNDDSDNKNKDQNNNGYDYGQNGFNNGFFYFPPNPHQVKAEKKSNHAVLIVLLFMIPLFIISSVCCAFLSNYIAQEAYQKELAALEDAKRTYVLPEDEALYGVYIAQNWLDSVLTITCFDQNPSYATSYSSGTGFVISSLGYIVTNAHVVTTTSTSGFSQSYRAYSYIYGLSYSNETLDLSVSSTERNNAVLEVLYFDTDRDLAILKYKTVPSDLKPVKLHNQSAYPISFGEPVVAIGNAKGYGLSVTLGIVSAPSQTFIFDNGYGSYSTITGIQTDAAINNGNSGGPLFNVYGEVIGINSFKVESASSSSSTIIDGMGYALPIQDLIDYISELKNLLNSKCRDLVLNIATRTDYEIS